VTLRIKRETLTFAHPFKLRGVDEAQPAGAYTVERGILAKGKGLGLSLGTCASWIKGANPE
jgi:hypothetical protein